MKTLFPRLAAAVLIATVLSFPAVAAESPSVLLQKGIYAEETEGNVDAAIKIYEQIAAESAANRPVVAQAQYRLAVCYQKKGNKEQAIKLLNDLVQQFPSDAAMTQKARATLTELGVTAPEAVSVRRIPLPISTTWIMSISQDGRFVAYMPSTAAEPKGNNEIAVCEVPTGKTWTVAKGTKENSPWYDAQISPNGQWIAWQLSRETGATIYMAKIDGSETRQLIECDEKKEEMELDGWSPDSTHVIVESWPSTGESPWDNFIFGFDAKTGKRKEIARVTKWERVSKMEGKPDKYTLLSEPEFIWSNEVSPDRRYVARRRGMYPRTITLLDLKAVHEEVLVDRDAGHIFGWFAGGTKLLYSKNRIGGTDLWATEIKDGKPLGEPELVWSNLGDVQPLRITPDGTIYGCYSRSEVLCVLQGVLTRNTTVATSPMTSTEIPPNEIIGPNNSILDQKFGLSASLPTGWTIRSAVRRSTGASALALNPVPSVPTASLVTIAYGPTTPWENFLTVSPLKGLGPKPKTSAETDSWLRNFANSMEKQRIERLDPNYKNRAASVTSRTVNGHHALSWTADFTKAEKSRTECFTVILGENVIASVWSEAPTESFEERRPALEQLIATIRLP